MKELLLKLSACSDAMEWAGDKTWPEIYTQCHRGDWLLWLFARSNPDNLREITLAKGHCANTVRHLMKDQKSLDAVDAAIAFGEGKINKKQLDATAYAAYAAYTAADATAYAAAHADADASAAADAAAHAAAADAVAYAVARIKNQLETANICRKYLPIEIWNITIN